MNQLPRKLPVAMLMVLTAGVGVLYAWARLQQEITGETPPLLVLEEEPTSHRVTPDMLQAAAAMIDQPAGSFQAPASDGQDYSLDAVNQDAPVALVFIKDGCPCSEAAQPYYNALFKAYGEHVKFFGVIDGDVKIAREWGDRHKSRFPILSDPDHELIRRYHVENSAYMVIIASGGKILRTWPGYSVDMIEDAGAALAEVAGTAIRFVDTTGAPQDMYTGCPFDF